MEVSVDGTEVSFKFVSHQEFVKNEHKQRFTKFPSDKHEEFAKDGPLRVIADCGEYFMTKTLAKFYSVVLHA